MSATPETSLGRELTQPWNLMSLVRVPLAVAVFLARADSLAVLALMAIAGLSDALDGLMARRAGADPRIGAWLDPVCDKIFVVGTIAGVWLQHQPPWHLIVLTATRELLVVPAGIALFAASRGIGTRVEYRARPSGKATTVAQFVVLGALLFDLQSLALPAAIAAALLGLTAGVEYGARARASLAGTPSPPRRGPARAS